MKRMSWAETLTATNMSVFFLQTSTLVNDFAVVVVAL
jgi:hypothetical protein